MNYSLLGLSFHVLNNVVYLAYLPLVYDTIKNRNNSQIVSLNNRDMFPILSPNNSEMAYDQLGRMSR